MKNKPLEIDMNQFRSPTTGKMSFDALVFAIVDYIKEGAGDRYMIGVGTDSQVYPEETVFATAIFVHRVGRGARYFYQRIPSKAKMGLHERMYEEARLSLVTSQLFIRALSRAIENLDMTKYKFELHVDVGENGKTREIVKQIVGWLENSQEYYKFEVRYKPEAICASVVADRHT
jgi:hypothetical protein